jgi:hypothetical protein
MAGGFGRRVYDQRGIVTKVTKGFGQEAQIAMPEKLIRPDS